MTKSMVFQIQIFHAFFMIPLAVDIKREKALLEYSRVRNIFYVLKHILEPS